MKNFHLPSILFVFCCLFSLSMQAQLDIAAVSTDYTIDFDNTVAGVNNGQWAAPSVLVMDTPGVGELDSDGWLLDPNDNIAEFQGQDDGTVGGGGWYAFDVGAGNYSLGVQPTSGFNGHSMTLTILNNSGQPVTELNIAFKLYANSPQGRVATINYAGASGTNSSGSEITDNILTNGTTTASTWKYIDHSLNITGISIPDGGTYTFSWSSNRGTGSGSSDEWALDDIVVSAVEAVACVEPTAAPTALSLAPSSSEISGDFTGTGDDGYLVVMSTSSTLSADPEDGTPYGVNDALGGGTVVSVSAATSFIAASLAPETQYYFFVFAYDSGCIGEPDYFLTALTGDATTLVGVSDCYIDNCNFEIVPVTQNSDLDNWSCTDGTYNVNGHCGCPSPSELWLVSPVFDFGANSILNFKLDISQGFGGSSLELLYTTSYTGNPVDAGNNWMSINTYSFAAFSAMSFSEDILAAVNNTAGVNFGIKYISTGENSTSSAFDVSNIIIESDDCSQISNECSITAVSTTNTSSCMNGGSPTDGSDDTFTADVVVSFVGAPATGNLVLSGDASATIAVGGITSPYTFTALSFPADGLSKSITATFDATPACTLTNAMAHPGLDDCTPAAVPWKETFDIAEEGIGGICADATDLSMCDTNNPPLNDQWSIELGTGTDLMDISATTDYLKTVGGLLEARDLDTELCFLSEVIDISNVSAADFSVEISATESMDIIPVTDYADIYLSIDGTETQISNWNNKGDASHTLVGPWGDEVVTQGAITGTTLQIRICMFNNAAAEYVRIDNICAAEAACRISDIAVDNVGTCDSNDPAELTDDFYLADVIVAFSTIPTTGTLDLTGDIIGTPPSVDASTLMGGTYTFEDVQLRADGTPTDLTAVFSAEPSCMRAETAVDPGMTPCCAVSMEVSNTSDCMDNGTTGNVGTEGDDDFFTTDIVITYFNAPTTGNLILSGDINETIDVTTITSPYTYNSGNLLADGMDLNVNASFSADASCMDDVVIPGVSSCSEIMPTTNGGLLINELADETQSIASFAGNPEYVELLVIGEAADPTLNVNVEGWIIDDNNSIANEFGTTSESPGCYRIKTGCLTDVPAGSLILIYNAGEVPSNMPAVDETDSNGDNIYVLASDSPCLESTTEEIVSEASYTSNTYGVTNVNSWTISLNFGNTTTGDVIQTRRPDGTFYHGMAYTISGVTYPLFPNGNMSFTTGTSNNISYSCGNSTVMAEYAQSAGFTPGATNNANNAVIVQALLDGTVNYDELIGTAIPSGDCAALAVEWVDFIANLNDDKVVLKWLTANEKDNDRFEIEHSSDGLDFKKIGTMSSKGDANTIQDYQFVHKYPVEGNNYYRLRQVDYSGAADFSSVQTVLYQKVDKDITFYPNPVENILNIDFGAASNVKKQITLIHTNGQIVQTIDVAAGTERFEFFLKNMPSGMYWIQVVMDTEIMTQKIVKE